MRSNSPADRLFTPAAFVSGAASPEYRQSWHVPAHNPQSRSRAFALIGILTDPADPTLTQELRRVLHLLYVSAGVLTIFLVLLIGFAIWVYRRNKAKEPTP